MTGSKQGHLRYNIRKKLISLIGEKVSLLDWHNNLVDSGLLVRFTNMEKSNENGFYVSGRRIPLRSIDGVTMLDIQSKTIHIIPNYLHKSYSINYDAEMQGARA